MCIERDGRRHEVAVAQFPVRPESVAFEKLLVFGDEADANFGVYPYRIAILLILLIPEVPPDPGVLFRILPISSEVIARDLEQIPFEASDEMILSLFANGDSKLEVAGLLQQPIEVLKRFEPGIEQCLESRIAVDDDIAL